MEADGILSFTADGFSVYGIAAYTVDFHWSEDGKSFAYGITGGSGIGVGELAEALGIVSDDPETPENETVLFADDIESVEFSDPDLLRVGKTEADTTVGALIAEWALQVEYGSGLTEEEIRALNEKEIRGGDWALISLKPFASEERLTVSMKSGDRFEILVTDAQLSARVMTADGEDYIITVTFGPEAGIPDGARLEAEEIPEGSDAYAACLERAAEELYPEEVENEILFARFFDVVILADGEKIEPLAPVRVEVTYAQAVEYGDSAQAATVHFAEDAFEVIPAELSFNGESGSTTFLYEQGSFSMIGTVISNPVISDGKYFMVVVKENGTAYALLNDGSTVPITYDRNSKVVTFNDAAYTQSALWNFTKVGSQDYTVQGENGNYVTLAYDQMISSSSTALRVVIQSDSDGGYKFYHIAGYAPDKVISYDGNSNEFVARDYNYDNGTSTDNAQRLFLARYTVGNTSEVETDYPVTTGQDVDRPALDDWLDKLLESMYDNPLMGGDDYGKTAQVYDYQNRIYQIDITARSRAQGFAQGIDLGFLLDMSNSMLFPSKLTRIGSTRLNSGALDAIDPTHSGTYFVISNVQGTATVNAVFYEGGTWKYEDASKWARHQRGGGNTDYAIGSSDIRINTATDSVVYTLYTADQRYVDYVDAHTNAADVFDNPYNRLHDLKNSVKTAFNFLSIISDMSNSYANAGWNGFAGYISRNASGSDPAYSFSASLHPLTPMTGSAYDSLLSGLYVGTTGGGTRPDLAFQDAVTNMGFDRSRNPDKYAILITDGAPQGGASPNDADYLIQQTKEKAAALKRQGVKVVTVGLSMERVKSGAELLRDLADVGPDGEKMFYIAEDGDALYYCLMDILYTLTAKAGIISDVSDTIDDAFYPVDENGLPLEPGDWIDLNGHKMKNKNPDVPHGVIGKNGENWTVLWENQEIIWPDKEHPNGWNGKILVKAKEDFLGGNTIRTNETDAEIDMKKVKIHGVYGAADRLADFEDFIVIEDEDYLEPKKMKTPYVNVDEFTLDKHDTEWTVYLGTEVTPRDQLLEFFNNTLVYEVVSKSAGDHRRTADSKMITENGFTAETMVLKDVVGELSGEAFQTLLENGTLDLPYTRYNDSRYGTDDIGTITLTVTKNGTGSDYETHPTETTGTPVETYTLKVEYKPNPVNTTPDYHTTPGGSPGDPANNVEALNTHRINVYAKKLTLEKVDERENPISDSGAVFLLYRKAEEGDSAEDLVPEADVPGILPAGNRYVLVETLTTSAGRVTTSGDLNRAYEYYLTESKAPDGYNPLPGYLKVTVDTKDTYTQTLDPAQTSETAWDPWVLSGWVQTSTILISGAGGNAESGYAGPAEEPVYDAETASVRWWIKNYPGVALPATGGPGAALFDLVGALTAGAALTVAALRKKERDE